ncbi:ArsR family transcriptional regulator [Halobacteriales archaeon QS_1_68_20]|nr:MAG: ArsR family transcriptional regulator [Halobacteriales archaeon QS_1_68_20]
MANFDETDMEILELLVDEGRRPYSDIADEVGLSPPTVSDRIDRLQEAGVIRQFTVDLDRSTLSGGIPVLIEVSFEPDAVADGRDRLAAHEAVEHVFTTADASVVVDAFIDGGDARNLLEETVDLTDVREYDVRILTDADWTPGLGREAFALECAECGNTVSEEGESVDIDGSTYHFCCSSCRAQFVDQYESLQEEAAT